MSRWVYGIDISYHTITDEQVNLLKLAGIQVVFQCLWTGAYQPGPRVINLRKLLNIGGFVINGYISVAPGLSGDTHVEMGRAGVPDDIWEALKRVPIDVELSGLSYPGHVLPALDRIMLKGKPPDVYTNHNTWVNILGNPAHRAGTGLWNALWDEQPDFDFPTLRYGAWRDDEVWGEQWSGGTNIHGVFADRNQFRASAFGLPDAPPTGPTPPPPPTDAQYLRAEEVWGQIVDRFGKRNHLLTGTTLREQAKFLLRL